MTTSRSKWVAAIAVGAFVAPVALHAQDTTQTPVAAQQPAAAERTHVVKEGDTLWDLARLYLGDPFLWPEIYRLNTNVVEDPHWIYPGEVLNLPGGGGESTIAATPTTTGEEQGPATPSAGTVFQQRRITAQIGSSRLGVLGRDRQPVVREGEYYAAPFVVRDEGPSDPGEVLRSADHTGISRQSERSRFQTRDQLFVELPKGKLAIAGDRYLTYREGPQLPGLGRVLMPTAVLVVDRASPGEATLAHVELLFDEVKVGQDLIPLEEFPLKEVVRPAPVERGPRTKVVWVQDQPVLASLHHYLVLEARERDGVRVGDQYTLFTERTDAEGTTLAERPVATVQVVRVTPHGATALIVDRQQPRVSEGMRGRLTAKMP